jgi:mannose-6-phosphate isomerase-like protein (cupin superfamily)
MYRDEESSSSAVVVEPGEGEAIWFLNSRMTVKATAETTRGAYGLIESVIPPGFSPPMHVHHRDDESYFVLDGQLTVRCGDETYSASAGSYVFLPRDVPHTFVVEGDKPARWLTLTTPGGGEGFFVDASRPAESDGFPAQAPIDIELLRRVSTAYGNEIVGPPLTPRA